MLLKRNTILGRAIERAISLLPRFVPIHAVHARVGNDTTSFIVVRFG